MVRAAVGYVQSNLDRRVDFELLSTYSQGAWVKEPTDANEMRNLCKEDKDAKSP